jgi:hypothetical protein
MSTETKETSFASVDEIVSKYFPKPDLDFPLDVQPGNDSAEAEAISAAATRFARGLEADVLALLHDADASGV